MNDYLKPAGFYYFYSVVRCYKNHERTVTNWSTEVSVYQYEEEIYLTPYQFLNYNTINYLLSYRGNNKA